jgi:hypothetical protein
MHAYQIGQPYNATRHTPWPETPYLRVGPRGVEVAIFLEQPTPDEVTGVRNGLATFAWVDAEHVGILAFQFQPGIPWSDCPFHPYPVRLAGQDVGPPAAYGTSDHQLVSVVLVDATSGVVMALRAISWPPPFVAVVGASIQRMLAAPWQPREHDRVLTGLYQRYTSTAELVQARATATCTGGGHEGTTASSSSSTP